MRASRPTAHVPYADRHGIPCDVGQRDLSEKLSEALMHAPNRPLDAANVLLVAFALIVGLFGVTTPGQPDR